MQFLSVLISNLRLPLILNRVPAGFPSPAEDFVEGSLDLNDYIEHPAATYFVKAEGDSMIGAGIYDGDLLIVDRSIEPKNGSIVIASVMGDLTIKRLKRNLQGKWLLVPENPDYPIIPLVEESQIWGVVKNSVRNLE
jgi:DNA polymerase V|tara:strand:+ start:443 stop:853 length:411 start_codon:yes stop_codon:yes gene_type:complete